MKNVNLGKLFLGMHPKSIRIYGQSLAEELEAIEYWFTDAGDELWSGALLGQ